MALKNKAGLKVFGRALLLVVCGILLLLPVLLIAHPIAYVPFISAVLLVVVSFVYLQLLKRNLSVHLSSMAAEVERGSDGQLSVVLQNKSFLPAARVTLEFFVTNLFGETDEVQRISCSIKRKDTLNVNFNVRFVHLGTYYAGISNARVFDLLGLFSSGLQGAQRRQVVVSPREVDFENDLSLLNATDESKRALRAVLDDNVDYAQVREYRPGDPMKTVHWNLSAKSVNNAMYTRLFETHVNPSLSVVIDPLSPHKNSEDLMSTFDGMVEAAAAICKLARQCGIDSDVHFMGKSTQPEVLRIASTKDACNLVSRMHTITHVAKAGALDVQANEMLARAGLQTHSSGSVALITSRSTSKLITTLQDILHMRKSVLAFLIVSSNLVGKERKKFCAPLKRISASGGFWWAVESNEVSTKVVGR